MDSNYFSTRDQYILISYQDVIKQTYATMIEKLIKEYSDDLGEILDLDKIKHYDIYNLQRLCTERIYKNPLRYLAKSEEYFDVCDKLLETFEDEMVEIYTDTDLTSFGAKLYNIAFQPFVKKIYIYTERPIYPIVYDCSILFKTFEDKIQYVSGDIVDIIKNLEYKPTCYVLNDMDIAKKIIDSDYIQYTEILIAEQGFNYILTEDYDLTIKHNPEPLMKERIFKLGTLPILKLEKKHITCLEEVKHVIENMKNDNEEDGEIDE